MTSTKKTRNKRLSKLIEESPDKDGSNGKTNKPRKRKLSDMLGSQWSKEEIERFYDAYCKYGKDWEKVAAAIRNRSLDMVEALYNMNKAYLSLSKRTTSAAVLIAMMTDHYNILDGSDSDHENNDGFHQPKQRNRGKCKVNLSNGLDEPSPNLLQYQSSRYGCLALLKKKRSGGNKPRAVGKRTPRFPVLYDRDENANTQSQNKKELKPELYDDDYDVAHGAALALAEALHRGGSPQVWRTPSRKTKHMCSSPYENGKKKVNSKFVGSEEDEDHLEGSVDSRETGNGDFAWDNCSTPNGEHDAGYGSQQKGMKLGKKQKIEGEECHHSDEAREACSGTEGRNPRNDEDEINANVAEGEVPWPSQGPRKRIRQLFGDEGAAVDALQTLADLSVNALLPGSAAESESSVQVKEEKKNVNDAEEPAVPGMTSFRNRRDRSKALGKKDKGYPPITDGITLKNIKIGKGLCSDVVDSEANAYHSTRKTVKKKMSLAAKGPRAEPNSDSCYAASQKTEAFEDGKKYSSKSKCPNQIFSHMKQGKSMRSPEQSSPGIDLGKTISKLAESAAQASAKNQVSPPTKCRSRRKMDPQKAASSKDIESSENIVNLQPGKHSLQMLDQGALLKKRICHCLSSQMLRRWCAFEWFYSAIDCPFFAKNEFVEYLDHVGLGHIPRLTHFEWGVIRGSLGKPRRLSNAFLREEREKLEEYRESIRSHYAELCSDDMEGLPTNIAKPLVVGQRVIACHPKTREIHDGSILTVDRNRYRVKFDRADLGVKFVMDIDCMPLTRGNNPGLILDVADGSQHISSTTPSLNALVAQIKGDNINDAVQAKSVAHEVSLAAQRAMYGQPCDSAQIQEREADVRALSEFRRALYKKELLHVELSNMNDDVFEKRINLESPRDTEPFRKQYAMVGNALLYLRQRNTYYRNLATPCAGPPANTGLPAETLVSAEPSQKPGYHVIEIVESTRQKAKVVVDAAVQAMISLKEGEDAFARVGEAVISANKRHSGKVSQDQAEPDRASQAADSKQVNLIDGSAMQLPSELIQSCVGALLMIQACSDRQYPPGEAAKILDSVLTGLQPSCSQNLPIYRDIEDCMGLIKNQMLSLVPT
ncbi:Protein ALWAYS EARLY 3 [Acorus gramineus]|uniref:Protein ALWAYS EARLY 3 n=1 Tax=Acorus gramineus TaxID=55184 RepID=A0AAV9BL46_ACOGR|nr:Protein ALWAYS EARLY 3 [Acorus gramineus]